MANALADRARRGRRSPAVLKISLSYIRSRDQSIPVLIFEGHRDCGPYRAWISRIRDALAYERIWADGKDQVLEFRRRLKEDASDLAAGVFFFVDRDFDDLKGHPAGPDVFCTDRYSVENYLVSDRVLQNLLVEEFQCDSIEDRDKVSAMYRQVLSEFSQSVRSINQRIFIGRRLGIIECGIGEVASRHITISLSSVADRYTPEIIAELLPFTREPTDEEVESLSREFDALEPVSRYRGKFFLSFFFRWLELLAVERRQPAESLFSRALDVKFSVQKIQLDSLASRAEIPAGLPEFIAAIG